MNETTLLIAFIAVTAVAVVLQMLILAGMYVTMRKSVQRMEALQTRVNEQVLPTLEKVRSLVEENAPLVSTVVANVTETSGMVRAQAVKVDEAVTEIITIARKQAGHADVLATRTMERADRTAAVLQHTVTSPIRHFSALIDGVMTGIGEFTGARRERRAKSVPVDDMFI